MLEWSKKDAVSHISVMLCRCLLDLDRIDVFTLSPARQHFSVVKEPTEVVSQKYLVTYLDSVLYIPGEFAVSWW